MNKNRMILAAVGGVIAVATAAAAVFAYLSYAAKVAAVEGDDETEGLESAVEKARRLSTAPVYPCQASVKEIEANTEKLSEWLSAMRKVAAAGDRAYEKTSPAAFKTFIVRDAKRLIALPGGVDGAIAAADFAFGPFKNFVAGGDMPSEAQVPELQRRWDDVATVVETLSACGACELKDVQFKVEDDAAKKAAEEASAKNSRKGSRRQQRKGAADAAAKSPSAAYSYVFSFTARASAIVKAVNAFATCERFVTVDEVFFRRDRDAMAEALGGEAGKKNEVQAQSGRRRRRGGGGAPAAEAAASPKVPEGIVTDPAIAEPFTVTMAVTVHDFRSLEESDKEKAEEGKK